MHGATGSLARRQHLGGLLAIRDEGGLPLQNGDRLVPDFLLVGRNEERLAALGAETGLTNWTTDLDSALAAPGYSVFFEAAASGQRIGMLARAVDAGKHIYAEKPVAGSVEDAMRVIRAADKAGLRHGTVQDKLFLPGFGKLPTLAREGFFGRILEIRLEMGQWVFDGTDRAAQRASWNYRKRDGGGIMIDMFPHWRYMIEGIVGPIRSISATCRTQIPRRIDENGQAYDVDVEDSAFAQMEVEGGAVASVNCSWSTRVRRDATIQIQIDGTNGSAVATPSECFVQSAASTPLLGRSSDGAPRNPRDDWEPLATPGELTNSYRRGWEFFLRHVVEGGSYKPTLLEGAKGVQLAQLGYQSSRERRWIDVPDLTSPSSEVGSHQDARRRRPQNR
jgi:predicted dehydrogenase